MIMPQERIDAFLKRSKGTLTDDEFNKLNKQYFQAKKTDWYTLSEAELKWDQKKVNDFWNLLRLHAMPFFRQKKRFDFRGFRFPEFEKKQKKTSCNFWEPNEDQRFEYPVDFEESEFYSTAQFTDLKFLDEVHFTRTKFNREALFQRMSFKGETYFSELKAGHRNSDSKEKIRFNCPLVSFKDVDFSDQTKFSRFDISNVKFTNCNVTQIYFDRCKWENVKKRGRFLFPRMEENIKKSKDEIQNAENQYRQLKQNFTNIGNWELAGYAYVAEMEMRKKQLKKDHKYHIWIFYAFYGTFGGYTQNFIRPLLALLFSFIGFALIYYLIDFNAIHALQRSINGSLPYIEYQDEFEYKGIWLFLKNVQFVLNVALLSFFVFALRNRFKL